MSFHPVMPYGTEQWHRSRRVTLPEGPEFSYTAENRQRFEEFAAHYPPQHRKAAVLHALYAGLHPETVVKVDALAELGRLDLDQHLSSQRSNGLRAMVNRIRAIAQGALEQA